MGMYLSLYMLGHKNASSILKWNPLIWKVLKPDDPEGYERAVEEMDATGSMEPEEAIHFKLEAPEGTDLDLDKSWHGLHYLFTKTDWEGGPPACFLLKGGVAFETTDLGYGPARYLDPSQTKAFHDFLQEWSEEKLRSRYDPQDMTGRIYPEIWDRKSEEENNLNYLLENFHDLREFISQAVQARLGVVIWVS